jgi:hypothetical protein
MSRNSLRTNRTGLRSPQQIQVSKPGDYALGSLESRAAARALLDARLMGQQQNRVRVIVGNIGKAVQMETSTCLRYESVDSREPGQSLVIEMVELDGTGPTEDQLKQLDQWICRVPIDGKKYRFGEVGNV